MDVIEISFRRCVLSWGFVNVSAEIFIPQCKFSKKLLYFNIVV